MFCHHPPWTAFFSRAGVEPVQANEHSGYKTVRRQPRWRSAWGRRLEVKAREPRGPSKMKPAANNMAQSEWQRNQRVWITLSNPGCGASSQLAESALVPAHAPSSSVAIPAMSISDSDLMAISSERSDAGVFILAEVIGSGQGSRPFPLCKGKSSSSRFSFVLGCCVLIWWRKVCLTNLRKR